MSSHYGGQSGNFRVTLIDNDNGGEAGDQYVTPGTTIGQFFAQRKNGANAANYKIRVNDRTADLHEALRPNDRVTISAAKLAGARIAA